MESFSRAARQRPGLPFARLLPAALPARNRRRRHLGQERRFFAVTSGISLGIRGHLTGSPSDRELIIPPKLHQTIPRASPEPRRSLPVVPLIGDQRYYGEAPGRLRWS